MIDTFEGYDEESVDRLVKILTTPETVKKLLNAVRFYADPDTYYATTLVGDSPCGDIADDFSMCYFEYEDGHMVEDTFRLGKLARETLDDIDSSLDLSDK